ncbi:MAG: hypothetical protein K9K39_06370 [Desulfohalobiaceae bacterium]|nr:hypothetical protein [Desulfohalobiaceae bacterium]
MIWLMCGLEVDQLLRNYHVHVVAEGALWASSGETVYTGDAHGRGMTALGRAGRLVTDRLARFALVKRLLRLGIHKMIRLQSGTLLVVCRGNIYRWDGSQHGFARVHTLRFGRRPLHLTEDGQGNVYYGEYWTNDARREVRLWQGTHDGRRWNPVYTFHPGAIRHIHAVLYDPFGDLLWIATGDHDQECAIGYSEDLGGSFRFIGEGSQRWRAVDLLFTAEGVYWGSDDPQARNSIFRWDRASQTLEQVGDVIGPVYYAKRFSDLLFFSTTVERGEGDQDGYARIYALDPDHRIKELYSTQKDSWHPILFGYGTIEFPQGDINEAQKVWIRVTGLEQSEASILLKVCR